MELKEIAVVGPTASGKTRRAVEIARSFNGEIISCDSRQVYCDMTLGTGKDIDEYGEIKYHLIDIANAGEKYNLHRFLKDFKVACDDIKSRGKRIIACGGSGMYIENALSGICLPEVPKNNELRQRLKNNSLEELTEILEKYKELHNKTDIDTIARAIRAIEISDYYKRHPEEAIQAERKNVSPRDVIIIGIDIDRESRRKKISDRLKTRLEEGMLDEVRNLLDKGISADDLIYYGLEYKFVTLYLIGELSYKEMYNLLEIAIHQFAKRQMTWFRGMEKRGFHINWLPYDMPTNDFVNSVEELLNQ